MNLDLNLHLLSSDSLPGVTGSRSEGKKSRFVKNIASFRILSKKKTLKVFVTSVFSRKASFAIYESDNFGAKPLFPVYPPTTTHLSGEKYSKFGEKILMQKYARTKNSISCEKIC